MKWKIFPALNLPDWSYWESHFPRGLGSSIFSAPGWQRLMCREADAAAWDLRWLESHNGEGRLSMPVFVRKSNWNRKEISVRPIGYYVFPIESSVVDESLVVAVLEAAQACFTAGFTWWLPPWTTWTAERLSPSSGRGKLTVSAGETYVIALEGSVEDHLDRRVSKTLVRHLRASLNRGIEIIERPDSALVEEYYRLYSRVWEEGKWIGPRFSLGFFRGVADGLGDGGKLTLMRYQNRLIGGGVVLQDHHAVHYFQGAMDRTVREVYPHCVLYEMLLRQAQSHGLRYVNLGGVNPGNHGLARFKTSWGAREVPVPILRWQYDGPPRLRRAVKRLQGIWCAPQNQPPAREPEEQFVPE